MKPDDIYRVDLPSRGGRAQSGRRPAIVVQSERVSNQVPTVLLAPLTTQLDALRFPGAVLVQATAENGLRRSSVAPVFQLNVVDQRVIGARLGAAAPDVLDAIWHALDEVTGR